MTYISYYSKDLINSGDIYLSLSQSTLITYNCHYAKYLIYSRDVGLLRDIIPNILSTLITHIICYYAKDLLYLFLSLTFIFSFSLSFYFSLLSSLSLSLCICLSRSTFLLCSYCVRVVSVCPSLWIFACLRVFLIEHGVSNVIIASI